MAEDLDDGEFWLPSHFLTDDDILMDFTSSITPSTSTSTSLDSDEDDHLSSQISLHLSSCPLHSKGYGGGLTGSPQSTLSRCVCNHQSSSRESVSPPPPPPKTAVSQDNTTLNLLNKAADEVARLKLRSQNNKIGTGFFDCSQQHRVSYPPPLLFQPHFLPFPPMVWTPSNGVEYNKYNKHPKQQENRGTNKNNTTNNKISNRPLGLPLSAWPPLQAQAQAQAQHKPPVKSQPEPQKLGPSFVGPPKGTGVFLPRRLPTCPANQTRNKSDGNGMKSKNGKGSQLQANNNKRNNGKPSTTFDNEIKLPQEWTY